MRHEPDFFTKPVVLDVSGFDPRRPTLIILDATSVARMRSLEHPLVTSSWP
jgi:hypothetical protein